MNKSVAGLKIAIPLLSAAFCPFAHATDVIVNPGNVGASMSFIVVSVPELVGTPLDGSTLTVAVKFSDGKYIEWMPGPNQLARSVNIDYFSNPLGVKVLGMAASGGITDSIGNLVGEAVTRAESYYYGVEYLGNGGAELRVEPAKNSITFQGALINLQLPSVLGASITSSVFILTQDYQAQGIYHIGQVPEPSTFVLLAAGIAVIGTTRGLARRGV